VSGALVDSALVAVQGRQAHWLTSALVDSALASGALVDSALVTVQGRQAHWCHVHWRQVHWRHVHWRHVQMYL
jgi:hypothetical protein